jgi:hypothetical protein
VTPPSAGAAAHPRTVRRGTTPRGPRRISGPTRTPAGRSAAPKRVSPNQLSFDKTAAGAASAPRAALGGGAVALPRPGESLAPRLIRGATTLAESRWLDRLLRGRVWIALVAVGLIGLVFMQVSLLKINAGMGRDVERAAALEQAIAIDSAEVSKLASNDRIQQIAMTGGMILPAAGNVRYLGRNGKRVGGDAAGVATSEAAATTATLPTLPDQSTEHPSTTAAPPATSDQAPQTITIPPAPSTAAAAAPPPPTAATSAAATTATAPQTSAPTTPAPAAATAATGGAAPTGLDGR